MICLSYGCFGWFLSKLAMGKMQADSLDRVHTMKSVHSYLLTTHIQELAAIESWD